MNFLRRSIGNDKGILLALFRLLDQSNKGFLVIGDFVHYMNEFDGDFEDADLIGVFIRITKSSRANFEEFCREFGNEISDIH